MTVLITVMRAVAMTVTRTGLVALKLFKKTGMFNNKRENDRYLANEVNYGHYDCYKII